MKNFFDIKEVEKSIVDFINFAENGSVEHQEKLGIYYWLNFDLESAEKYLELAANNGSVSAMVMLAQFLTNSPMSDADNLDAMRDAFINDEFDNYDFEECIKTEDIEKKKERAIQWLKKAAEAGDTPSMLKLSEYYRNIPGCEKLAFEWCLKAAELGNVGAQNDTGSYYRNGYGVDKNYDLAYKWYSKAASQGNATATYNLGNLYRCGHGVEKNVEKAFELLLVSAQNGYEMAQNEVGIAYEEGEGVEKNPYEAYKWYQRSAILGAKHGKYNFAQACEKGIGEEVDYEKAFIIYYELATLDEPYALACNEIGRSFLGGHGVQKDAKQAVLWFKKGANLNEPWSINNLADCYEKGEGVKQDLAKAEKLRKKAEKILNEKN